MAVANTGTVYIDALTYGASWTGNAGQAVSVSYAFSNSTASVPVAMQEWANVANVTFHQVAYSSSSFTSNIDFFRYDLASLSAGAIGVTLPSATSMSTAQPSEKLKKPDWIRVKAPQSQGFIDTHALMRKNKLNTVCEEAACPNIGECWSKSHATVMILGSVCTRACAFCNIATGQPDKLDPHEPKNLAEAVGKLDLKHVVITSVDRDDLDDGGAAHFAECIEYIRTTSPNTTIEILTPDFLRKEHAIPVIAGARPDVFNHNIETVPSLYKSIRPGARYFNSLHLLKTVKELQPKVFTKSGIMVGLGETNDEVLQVMDDLRSAEVDFMTIGQYLQPTPNHAPVKRYVTPEEFDYFQRVAYTKGFLMVSASPLTRSSYHADADFAKMRDARNAK